MRPSHPFGDELRARILANLDRHDRLQLDEPAMKHAAVAISVVPSDQGSSAFLLTRRNAGLRSHSNQYALPGGRLDEGELALDAARRELHEEVGVPTPASAVLGVLDDYKTRSGYVITPVVVWLEDLAQLEPQPGEVDEIHIIDLAELDRPDSPRWITIEESDRQVLQLPLRNRLIHAPTGALLYQFREVALWGRTVRTTEVEEPTWAWR